MYQKKVQQEQLFIHPVCPTSPYQPLGTPPTANDKASGHRPKTPTGAACKIEEKKFGPERAQRVSFTLAGVRQKLS